MNGLLPAATGGLSLFLLVFPVFLGVSKSLETEQFASICSSRRKIPGNIAESKYSKNARGNFMFYCTDAQRESPLSASSSAETKCSCLYAAAVKGSTEKIDLVNIYVHIFRSEPLDPKSDNPAEFAGMATFVPAMSACSS